MRSRSPTRQSFAGGSPRALTSNHRGLAGCGSRATSTAVDREALRNGLQARGVNPLLSGAFEPRHPPEAA